MGIPTKPKALRGGIVMSVMPRTSGWKKRIHRVGLLFILGLTATCVSSGYGQAVERKAPYGVLLADLNGDGFPDIVSTNYVSNTLTIRYNDGTGNFPEDYTLDIAVGESPTGVLAVDLNG